LTRRAKIIKAVLRAWHGLSLRTVKVVRFRRRPLVLAPTVFDPRYSVSTPLTIDVATRLVKSNHRVLEIGCGSGVISIALSERSNFVVGYDINPLCIAIARINAALNNVNNVLFTNKLAFVMDNAPYDVVISNPPYLPLDPSDPLDFSWCCGTDYEVLKDVVTLAMRSSRKGSLLLLTCSSETPLSKCIEITNSKGFRLIDMVCTRTLFDSICVLIFLYLGTPSQQ